MLPSAQQNFSSDAKQTGSKSKIMNLVRGAYAQNQSLNLANQFSTQNDQPQTVDQPSELIDQGTALDTLDQVLTEIENEKHKAISTEPEPQTTQPSVQPQSVVVTPDSNPVPPVANQVPLAPSADEQLQAMAQAVPQVAMAQTDTLNPAQATTSVKEQESPLAKLEINTSSGVTEAEPSKEMELPVEVESYVQQVVDHQNQIPEEIVVADDGASISTKSYPSQPVVVLPITEEEEKEGIKKSPEHSFRWLVEFSRKVMKIFSGAVIYKQEE